MKGHVYKRGKTYTYVIDLGKDPFTNKRNQKTKGGFKTKKVAETELAEIQTKFNNGVIIQKNELALKEYCKKWFNLYSNTGRVKISTIRTREYEIDRINNYFKDAKLKNITRSIYQDFLIYLFNNYSINTMLNTHRTAVMIFNEARKDKYINEVPTKDIIMPQKQLTVKELENKEDIPKYFEKDELENFLVLVKQEPEPQLFVAFLVLAYTGMRIGELCALKWKDIDLVNGEIYIYKTLYCPGKTIDYVLLTPKTKGSIRTITIDATVIEVLKKHKIYQNEFRLRIPSWHQEGFVFSKYFRNSGYPETTKQLDNRFKEIIDKNNIKKLTPHGLRHTHVSLLAQANVSLETIMERLGHNDDKTTRLIYLHITKSVKKDASQKFEELMKSM